jgi:hypothetical protein
LLTRPPLSLSPPPTPLSLSPPPSLFPDKKFPVEAHFWLDELFYYKDLFKCLDIKKLYFWVQRGLQILTCIPDPKKSNIKKTYQRIKGSWNLVSVEALNGLFGLLASVEPHEGSAARLLSSSVGQNLKNDLILLKYVVIRSILINASKSFNFIGILHEKRVHRKDCRFS